MRIVHTCLRYPPATGGVETYVRDIVEHTRSVEDNRDVRVVTSRMRTHGPISLLNPNLLLDDPAYIQRLHTQATPLISYPRLQALSYYLGHHQPDIIHSYSFWYQPADVAARYAKRHTIPFIFHPIFYENDIRKKAIWQLYKKTIGHTTFAAADVVVVISPFEQELIAQNNFPVKRLELIPPGININEYTSPRPNPFAAAKISGTILLIAGRISPGKGIDDVINVLPELIKNHADLQLVIAGEDFGAKKTLKQQIESLGIHSHVHWLKRPTKEQLIGALQHADIVVHPSHYEAFGIVPAEALAASTPVVARNTAALPYVVPNQKAGLLFSNSQELVSHLSTLINNPKLRQRYGQEGHIHIRSQFSWQKNTEKLLKLYEELTRK